MVRKGQPFWPLPADFSRAVFAHAEKLDITMALPPCTEKPALVPHDRPVRLLTGLLGFSVENKIGRCEPTEKKTPIIYGDDQGHVRHHTS